jgi:D-glycero-D-manno-heptose 1,7-bisphosphate phosphatase
MQAVFLDRDGVINENRADHVRSWAEFRFILSAPRAIARLSEAGVRVFVFTNQAIVNRGMITHQELQDLHTQMSNALANCGARIESVIYCPHRPDEHCSCRKPQPGLLIETAHRYGIDLSQAVVIGDALADMDAGLAAGCRSILVLTGRGKDQLALARQSGRTEFAVAADLSAAVEHLLCTEHDLIRTWPDTDAISWASCAPEPDRDQWGGGLMAS